jgi:DNA repair protein RecO (recombination protein O)
MTESAYGIILRTRPLTETSLIVHWLTPNLGRIATVAKGARRPKSPFAGKLDLFYEADFSFSRSRRSELHTLREANLREAHFPIREDYQKLQQAGYAAAFVEQATETDTPLPEIFALVQAFLKHLCQGPALPETMLALELKLLRELGMEPDAEDSRLNAGTKKILLALTDGDWSSLSRLKPSSAQMGELRQYLHTFLVFHLGRAPRGRSAVLSTGHPA